jgi:hypothetical protein
LLRLVFFLFEFEQVLVEELLQPLVGVVDAQLLEAAICSQRQPTREPDQTGVSRSQLEIRAKAEAI